MTGGINDASGHCRKRKPGSPGNAASRELDMGLSVEVVR
jgi:hypothetical protein